MLQALSTQTRVYHLKVNPWVALEIVEALLENWLHYNYLVASSELFSFSFFHEEVINVDASKGPYFSTVTKLKFIHSLLFMKIRVFFRIGEKKKNVFQNNSNNKTAPIFLS